MPRLRRAAPALLGLLSLCAACSTAPEALDPPVSAPARFRAALAVVGDGSADPLAERWWALFGDPALDALVERASSAHPDLAEATARLAEAEATRRAVAASSGLQLDARVGADSQRGALVNAAGDRGSLFDAALDLRAGGRLGSAATHAEQASAWDAARRAAERDQVRLQLQSDTASTYFAWRAQRQHALRAAEQAQGAQALLALADGRRRRGLADEAEALQAREAASAARARQAQAEGAAETLWNAVATLSGLAPADLPEPVASELLPVLPPVSAGLPVQVLQRRPDLAATQRAVWAEQQRLGLARDAQWPSWQLTASGGLAAADLGRWLQASAGSVGLGLLLSAPLFDGGRREAQQEAARAGLDRARAAHQSRLLQALREVDDQLALQQSLAAQAEASEAAAEASRLALARARAQAARGLVGQAVPLRAEQQAVQALDALQQLQWAQRRARVGLMRALGGGATPVTPVASLGGEPQAHHAAALARP